MIECEVKLNISLQEAVPSFESFEDYPRCDDASLFVSKCLHESFNLFSEFYYQIHVSVCFVITEEKLLPASTKDSSQVLLANTCRFFYALTEKG